jgi:hypothetical protein
MSFEIKPTPNVVDTNAEVIALIEDNISDATPTTAGIVFGATDSAGFGNVSLGRDSLANVSTGRQLVAIGFESLMSTTNNSVANTAVGFGSLRNNTTGNTNTALGTYALSQNTTGNFNIAIGVASLGGNTSGERNIAIGVNTLATNGAGSRNIAIGEASLYSSTGSQNTAIGWSTGSEGLTESTGSNNTIIGYEARPSSTSVSNEITLGNSEVNRFRVPGLGIDINNNFELMQIMGAY